MLYNFFYFSPMLTNGKPSLVYDPKTMCDMSDQKKRCHDITF